MSSPTTTPLAGAPTATDTPVIAHAALSVNTRIDELSGHQARTILHRLIDDLTTHPDELGGAAVLRIIERGLPAS